MSASSSTQGFHDDNDRSQTRRKNTFKCLRCPKVFSRSENLRRHFATHDLVGKYRCPVCHKHFSRSDLLKRHRKNHANDKVQPNRGNSTPVRTADIPNHETAQMTSVVPTAPNVHCEQHLSHLIDEEALSSSSPRYHDNRDVLAVDNTPHHTHEGHHNGNALLNGFMAYGDMSGLNLGSYDGDIAWTLDFAQSHPSVESYPDDIFMSMNGDVLGLTHVPTGVCQEDTVEVDEDETGEWPDRISRPESPSSPAPRRTYRNPQFWLTVIVEAEAAKLDPQPKYKCPATRGIDTAMRNELIALLDLPLPIESSGGNLRGGDFPPAEILDFFLLLYFQYVHKRFPVTHLATFDPSKTAPVLLMAMLLVGSSHSRSSRGWFTKLFYKRSRIALMRKLETDSKLLRSVDNLFALLLVCVAGTWSGGRESYEFAEGVRGVLVTASRRCRLLDCRLNAGTSQSYGNGRILDQMWHSWIESEKRKRLGLAIYIFDCQFPALFNNQPYISKAETANSVFPCAREYWETPTSDSWKMLIGPADIPPSTYYLHALNCCLLRKLEPLPSGAARTDNFGKIVLIYALHTHVFEWRQAISMLNPNGLANSYGNFIFEIGDGLRDRRNWLLDSLNNWYECYMTPDIDVAALLLYHLAFVSLNISLSDLHLAAGRSGSMGEGEIAEQSLASWANSESANETMSHVQKMLELAHVALAAGEAVGSSFEVAMSLFTGGLVCWAYEKHRLNGQEQQQRHREQVRQASKMLLEMGCWRMCSLFGVILKGFEDGR